MLQSERKLLEKRMVEISSPGQTHLIPVIQGLARLGAIRRECLGMSNHSATLPS